MKVLTGTFATIPFPKWQNVTTVAAPIRAHVRELLETMWDTMVDFLLVRICLCIRLAYTLSYNTSITFSVTSIFAILALHASGVFEKIAAESTAHDVVELL